MTTLTSPGSPSNWSLSVTSLYGAYTFRWWYKNNNSDEYQPTNSSFTTKPIEEVLQSICAPDHLPPIEITVISEYEFIEHRPSGRFVHWKRMRHPYPAHMSNK